MRDGEKLYLVPVRGLDSDWYKNIVETQILDKFRAKYGARDVEAYYPKRDVAVEVPLA